MFLRAVRKPNQITYTKFKMGNKKDELHADFETVEMVPVKKAFSEKKRLSCEILYSMCKSFRPLIIWGNISVETLLTVLK